ncbi:PA2BC Phospholipase, partial [Baryphthengus martii]|nr:PA2BC Phospholipase [Baryphthengus martii]
PGPGERKMKVLLMLALLFACSVGTAHGKHPPAFAPGLEGSTVGNLTAPGCSSGWGGSGTARASMDRCCLLRACCLAKLAARRCRLGPIQPLSALPARIPTCRSGSWCQRGACRCQRAAQLCLMRSRGLLRRRGRC